MADEKKKTAVGKSKAFVDMQDGTVQISREQMSGATQQLGAMPANPYLVVLFPIELYRRYPLNKGGLVLGRSQDVDISIPTDELLSRQHCQVSWDGSKIRVKDLGSTNGTFVDGSQITERELGPDNRLQVGKVVLKLEFKDQSELEREDALFKAATTDALTRVPNRRSFMDGAKVSWSAAKRANRWIHAILLDVDFFKKVNDTWGHPAGDFVLKEVAGILDRVRREEDLIARWGGEEFVFLLAGIESKQAIAFAERARKAIESHRITWEDKLIPVTVSLGLASVQGASAESLDVLIAEADARLYQAKRNGRNQVCAG